MRRYSWWTKNLNLLEEMLKNAGYEVSRSASPELRDIDRIEFKNEHLYVQGESTWGIFYIKDAGLHVNSRKILTKMDQYLVDFIKREYKHQRPLGDYLFLAALASSIFLLFVNVMLTKSS